MAGGFRIYFRIMLRINALRDGRMRGLIIVIAV